ncbi:18997_t:CDS:2, partial [Racocetra persica]
TQYRLIIRQQPKQARLCSLKERDRRPVDPPPIIQFKVDSCGDEAQNYLQSPYYFMCANLVHPSNNSDHFAISSKYLAGTIVSSLHKLKDIDNSDGGFFVFGDISVRIEGRYRLRFSLFEIIKHSDIAEGDDDNGISDGLDAIEISRKRSINLPSATSTLDVQHADTSCYLQHSPM